MKVPTVAILCACALAVALAWLSSPALHRPLESLALVAAAAGALWQQRAARRAAASLSDLRCREGECERRYKMLLEVYGEPVMVCALTDDGRLADLVEANEAACMALGYSYRRLTHESFETLVATEARAATDGRLTALREVEAFTCETVLCASGGHRLPVELSLRRLAADGRRLCLVVAHDISARNQLAELARGACHRDELTGLLNRYGFVRTVWEARRRARRHGARVLLLAVKLEGLRETNARDGHAAGDALLVATAEVLDEALRAGDVLARLAGDEFLGLAVLCFDDQVRLDRLAAMARFAEALGAKRAELGPERDLRLRFGSVIVGWDALGDLDQLLGRADQLLRSSARASSENEAAAVGPTPTKDQRTTARR